MAKALPTPEFLSKQVFVWYVVYVVAFVVSGLALWFLWPAN
jgi:hypothetical protein